MIFPVLHPDDSAYLLSDENKRDTVDVIDTLHFPEFCVEQLKAMACELDFLKMPGSMLNTCERVSRNFALSRQLGFRVFSRHRSCVKVGFSTPLLTSSCLHTRIYVSFARSLASLVLKFLKIIRNG